MENGFERLNVYVYVHLNIKCNNFSSEMALRVWSESQVK